MSGTWPISAAPDLAGFNSLYIESNDVLQTSFSSQG